MTLHSDSVTVRSDTVTLVNPVTVAAAEMGRKGGTNRAANMTPEQRSEAARRASLARWKAWRKAKQVARKPG